METFDRLWRTVADPARIGDDSVHGPGHWKRVERNGLLLATRTGADAEVVRLFALFHDCCRVNDGWDEGHGARGAEYAGELLGKAFHLSDERFELLRYACVWHTDAWRDDDPTIGTCWDADRLDLGRVGVVPHSRFMSTEFAREIAEYGTIQPFLEGSGVVLRD